MLRVLTLRVAMVEDELTLINLSDWTDDKGDIDVQKTQGKIGFDFKIMGPIRHGRNNRGTVPIKVQLPSNSRVSLGDFTLNILQNRRSHFGFFSIQPQLPPESEAIEGLLLAYKRKNIIHRFDCTFKGAFAVVLMDGNKDLYEMLKQAQARGDFRTESREYQKTCTMFYLDNPEEFAKLGNVSLEDFQKLGEKYLNKVNRYVNKYFMSGGKILIRPNFEANVRVEPNPTPTFNPDTTVQESSPRSYPKTFPTPYPHKPTETTLRQPTQPVQVYKDPRDDPQYSWFYGNEVYPDNADGYIIPDVCPGSTRSYVHTGNATQVRQVLKAIHRSFLTN